MLPADVVARFPATRCRVALWGVAPFEPFLTHHRPIDEQKSWDVVMTDIPEDDAHCARPDRDMKKSKSEIDRYIGSRIRERRLSLHLTQEFLASALGVSSQQVQNYEKGANGISAVRLFDVCKILNVSLASMFPPDHSRDLSHPCYPITIVQAGIGFMAHRGKPNQALMAACRDRGY
jgi:transcriptional regulator with XRE-family HTH domain